MRQTLNQRIPARKQATQKFRHTLTGAEGVLVGMVGDKLQVEITRAPAGHPDWFGEVWAFRPSEIGAFWVEIN